MFAPGIVTVAVSFNWTYDGISPIKLSLMGFFAALGLSYVILQARGGGRRLDLIPIYFMGSLLLSLSLALFLSGAPLGQQFFGVTGRNLGYLHYFFLTILLVSAFLKSNESSIRIFLTTLLPLGLFQSLYGIVQKIGLDPLPWKNPDSWMLGTFGNPNYLSSFLALSCIASFFAITAQIRIHLRVFHIVNCISSGLAILLSRSSQGLVLLSVGIFFVCLRYILDKKLIYKISYAVISISVFLFMLFGLLQVGPGRSLIYQASVSVRGDYWRAGVEMIKNHFFFGVGLDSYGDFYREYRDSRAVSRNGINSFSNSAHNIYIDLFATGGVFLFLSYCALNLLVSRKLFLILKSARFVNNDLNALAVVWIAFQIQTIISINVSGLAIWGWVAAGLIIGYEGRIPALKSRRVARVDYVRQGVSLFLIALFLLPCLILINTQSRMASAISRNDFAAIADSFSAYPRDAELMGAVAQALLTLKQEKYALLVAGEAVKENRRAVKAWRVILEASSSDPADKAIAAFTLRTLDPLLTIE